MHAFEEGVLRGPVQPTQHSILVASRVARFSYGIAVSETSPPRQFVTMVRQQ